MEINQGRENNRGRLMRERQERGWTGSPGMRPTLKMKRGVADKAKGLAEIKK